MLLDESVHSSGFGGLDERSSERVVDEHVERGACALLAHIAGAAPLRLEAPYARCGPAETRGDNLPALDMSRRVIPRELRRHDGSRRRKKREGRGPSNYSHSMVAGGFDEMS